jgi:HD-like signal output (HDOD) protein
MVEDVEKIYLAGLLHDRAILVNSLLYRDEFQRVLEQAQTSEAPLCEVEQEVVGYMHCDGGRILADIWRLPADISATIKFHHLAFGDHPEGEMSCVVYLADVLCRLRGLGYEYYQAREFDLAREVPWHVLQKKNPDAAAGLDLARFTFELDQYGLEVQTMVDSIFSDGNGAHGTRE